MASCSLIQPSKVCGLGGASFGRGVGWTNSAISVRVGPNVAWVRKRAASRSVNGPPGSFGGAGGGWNFSEPAARMK